jgi:hypothetical protein
MALNSIFDQETLAQSQIILLYGFLFLFAKAAPKPVQNSTRQNIFSG